MTARFHTRNYTTLTDAILIQLPTGIESLLPCMDQRKC